MMMARFALHSLALALISPSCQPRRPGGRVAAALVTVGVLA